MSMKKGYKTTLAALMGCSMMTPALGNEPVAKVQGASNNTTSMAIPKILLPVKPPKDDDDNDGNWNHIAIMNINMDGHTINNLITNETDASSAVNMQTLVSYLRNIEGDNLGNHVATQTLNLSNNKITNLANAYDGANGDAVNVWTLKKYMSEVPGDNLGNHVASQTLNLNNNVIQMGPITGYDQDTGAPIAGPGLVINNNMVRGLVLPQVASDATNKEYVDGLFSNIKGDNLGNHTATQSINVSNFKVINVAAPTAGGDATNKTYVDNLFSSAGKYKAGNGVSFGAADASGFVPISVNNTVVRTSGNQSIAGIKTFTERVAANAGITLNNQTAQMMADPVNPQDGVNLRTLQAYVPAGDNLGNHTATQSINVSNFKVINVAAPTAGGDATNKTYVDNLFSSAAKYKAGDGVSFGAADASGFVPINVDATVVRTAGNQTIDGAKVFTTTVTLRSDSNVGYQIMNAAGVRKSIVYSDSNGTRFRNYAADGTTVASELIAHNNGSIYPLTGYLDANSKTITRVADPVNGMDAVNLRTLQGYTPAGDNLGNHIATQALNLATFKAVGMGDANLAVDSDGVNVKTLKAYVAANGDDLGNHTATTNINVANNRVINVAAPVNGGDVTNKTYVDNLFSSTSKYKAGDGVSFGAADASGFVPINVDATVVRTSGNQSIAGTKTFTARVAANAGITLNNQTAQMMADPVNPQDGVNLRTLLAYTPAGDNLGNHTATQALNLATFKAVGMGDANLAVDSDGVNVKTLKAYVAANGDNLGNHTATTNINVANNRVINVAAPTVGGDATNKTYVDNLFSSAAKYKAGDGVSFGAADASGFVPINVDATVVRTSGNQSIAGTKTFTARVAANAGITLNNQTAQMMADPVNPQDGVNLRTLQAYVPAGDNLGNHTATQNINVANFKVVNVAAPTVGGDATNKTYVDNLFSSAAKYKEGDGVSFGAADASGFVPINVDNTVVRTSGNQTIAGNKTFTGSTSISNASNSNLYFRNDTGVQRGLLFAVATDNSFRMRNFSADGSAIVGEVMIDSAGLIKPAYGRFDANNRIISTAADPVSAQDVVNLRTLQSYATRYKEGDGVSFGAADASGLVPINVDATVVRTAGNQTINGVKSFTTSINVDSDSANGLRMRTAAGVTQGFIYTDGNGTRFRNYATDGTTVASELIAHNNGSIYPVTGWLDANSKTITRVADPVNGMDAVNLRTLQASIPAGDNLGNHTATQSLNMAGNPITNVPSLNHGSGILITSPVVRIENPANPGTGNFVLHVNDSQMTAVTRWGAQVSGTSMSLTPTNGWMVTSNRDAGFTVDGTWAAFGNVTRTGGTTNAWMDAGDNLILNSSGYANVIYKTYFDISKQNIIRNSNNQVIAIDNDPAFRVRAGQIIMGLPLSMAGVGGSNAYKITDLGDPVDNRDAVNLQYLRNYYKGGTGINVSATGIIDTDSSVIRNVGAQTIGGAKTFSARIGAMAGLDAYNQTITRVATPVANADAANKAYVDSRTSDIRLKKNIEEITRKQGLDIVRRLNPVTFDYKKDDKHSTGVIAQETREVMPYAVIENDDGYLGVDYIQFIAPLISSVQALDDKVNNMEVRIESLENRLEVIEAR